METEKTGPIFTVGQNVELHPCTDRWMRGDRFGEVTGLRDQSVRVRLTVSGKSSWFHQDNILHKGNRNP